MSIDPAYYVSKIDMSNATLALAQVDEDNVTIIPTAPNSDQILHDNDETALIIILSLLGLGLAPITVASNILVIVPFCRFSRVRTASNQILLALAITDCMLGMVLFISSLFGLAKTTQMLEPPVSLSYFLAMSMSTMQAVSLLLMVANAGDKALSLARPLHYSEIVTFTSVNAFIGASCVIASLIGIALPLTVFHVFTDLIRAEESLMLVPLGPTPERSMQISLLVFFTLPCGLAVSFCHMYVYSVASRHAKAIKREGSVRDRMASASYKLTTTSEAANHHVLDPHKLASSSNQLAIPRAVGLPTSAVILKDEVILKAGGGSSSSSGSSRYGTSLALVVVMVFATRIPSQLSSIAVEDASEWPLNRKNLVYVALNAPLLICSAVNPWMFAYHNLDLKPVMQRLLKRLCRGLSRPTSKDIENGLNTTRNDRSLMTQWQVSQFASAQTRRSRSSFMLPPPVTPPATIQAWPPLPTNGLHHSPANHRRKSCNCMHRQFHQKRRSFCASMKPIKTTRSRSCTNRAIPTVTVWDGDSIRPTKPEDIV